MDFETVKAWLTQQVGRQARNCRLKGLLGVVLCPVALTLALALVYGLLRFFSRGGRYNYHPTDPKICLWITLALVPVLFIGNWLSPRRDLMTERMEDWDAGDATMARFGPRRGEVMALLFLWILFTGPRLLDWGIASFREARRWERQDTHGCAAALWLLVTRYKKVPFEDFQRELPWLDLDAILPELARIPGVLNLKTPPPGLGLMDDLRQAIRTGGPLAV